MQKRTKPQQKADQPAPDHSPFSGPASFDPKTLIRMLPRLLAQSSRAEQLGNGFIKTQFKLLGWSLATGVTALSSLQGVMQDALVKLQALEASRQENDQPDEW
jgi:hypothetical protein